MTVTFIQPPRIALRVILLEPETWIARRQGPRLSAAGHAVTRFGSVDAAIAQARAGADAIVVAGATPVAWAARLREAGCTQPIILVTGPAYLATMREAYRAGLHDLLGRAVRSLEALPCAIEREARSAAIQAGRSVPRPAW